MLEVKRDSTCVSILLEQFSARRPTSPRTDDNITNLAEYLDEQDSILQFDKLKVLRFSSNESLGRILGLDSVEYRDSQIRSSFQDALNLLGSLPAVRMIELAVENVVPFRSAEKHSFYHPRYKRHIFINIQENIGRFHVFEEIIHQSGHSVLDSMSPDGARFINSSNDGFDRNHQFENENDGIHSPITRFHSLITLAIICESIYELINIQSLDQELELWGRLAFAMSKLSLDLRFFLGNSGMLTNLGIVILRACLSSYDRVLKFSDLSFDSFILTDQPYVFDMEIFASFNKNIVFPI